MKLGSEDYIPKRLIEERLLPLVQTIRKEQERTRRAPIFRRTSEAYLSAKHRAKIVAPTNLSVMILGENGTGKEHLPVQMPVVPDISRKRMEGHCFSTKWAI